MFISLCHKYTGSTSIFNPLLSLTAKELRLYNDRLVRQMPFTKDFVEALTQTMQRCVQAFLVMQ